MFVRKNQENLEKEINQLLKGTHMGVFIFKDLTSKLNNQELKELFAEINYLLEKHEIMLTNLAKNINGNPVDNAGTKGTWVDFMELIKNILLFGDKRILKEAKKSIKAANFALKIFYDNHDTLDKGLVKIILTMKDDYLFIHYNLNKYLLIFD